ncbi:MAG: hypothetical protein RL130_1361 [Actinomycetota bacterium]|jgi:NhaA family Na+:H+ antiporter
MRKRIVPLKNFLERETSGGILLLIASIFGLVIANSPLAPSYKEFFAAEFSIDKGIFVIHLTILKFVNYILMTFFFFVVGLEIKRELTSGHLSKFKDAITPIIAAIGGMAVPAAIYLAIAGRTAPSGWGVPVATDIALAVGLLVLLGKSVTPSLRSFLLGLAVIDDIGAILIIAFVYSSGVEISWIAAATASLIFILVVKRLAVRAIPVYIFFGFILWYGLYRSGVHPTLAGVLLGLLAPNIAKIDSSLITDTRKQITVIEWLEEKIHPWSTYLIVPIFAFANTGVEISITSLKSAVSSPIAWAVFFGLVIGKPVGVMLSVYAAKRLKVGSLPAGSDFSGILGTGSAAGIGFTVAIFIAHLAFKDIQNQEIAIIGIIFASLISGLLSSAILKARKNSSN